MDVVEDQFGVPVADPYRWLENDVRTDPRSRPGSTPQNAVTNAFLATLPRRDAFKQRDDRSSTITSASALPEKKGGHYFYTHNSGLQNQSVLFVRDGLDGDARLLIDPNAWSQRRRDRARRMGRRAKTARCCSMRSRTAAPTGARCKVLRRRHRQGPARRGQMGEIPGLAWAKDGSGFYYSRFPEPEPAAPVPVD